MRPEHQPAPTLQPDPIQLDDLDSFFPAADDKIAVYWDKATLRQVLDEVSRIARLTVVYEADPKVLDQLTSPNLEFLEIPWRTS